MIIYSALIPIESPISYVALPCAIALGFLSEG